MKFICVCSGISSPTSAWKQALGWEPLAYAEIDPFASAILAARYGASRPRFMPDPNEEGLDPADARARANAIRALEGVEWGDRVPNYGDFTRLRDESFIREADVLVGGTPCQDFSLAGLRASLGGARGNLTLEFIRLANAVDDLRHADRRPPAFHLWENVPGILTTKDNAFGTFLAGMVGSSEPILPGRKGGWTDAGVVSGPERVAAWRVLDAQHFGLAQRRRRVFVLACRYPGAWAVADALLPIIDSLRGDPPPSREEGAGVARSLSASTGGPSAKEQQYTFVAGARPLNALDERADGASGPSGLSGQRGRGKRRGKPERSVQHDGVELSAADLAPTLLAGENGTGGDRPMGSSVDTAESLVVMRPIAFSSKDHGQDAGELAPTLRAMGHHKSHPNAGGQIAVAFSMRGRFGENQAEPEAGPVSPALRTGGGDSSKPMVAITSNARTFKPSHFTRGKDGALSDISPALTADADKGDQDPVLFTESADASMVRRLTLIECERLQGFPDNFTLIPWSDARRDERDFAQTVAYLKSHGLGDNEASILAMTPDGPRYRVLGNSMARDVLEELGRKIALANRLRAAELEAAFP